MRRTLLHPFFLSCLMLGIFNQVLEKGFGIYIPLVHSYLDDLLCFPLILTAGLAAYRLKWPYYQLTGWHIWPAVLIYSVYFEWFLPQRSTAYTSDPIDVVMYVIGALLFQRFINRSGTDLNAARFQNS